MELDDDSRSDEQLVAAANLGHAAAFEALYLRHREWGANLAFRFTGDRDLALDVLQETFLYLLKKFPGFVLTCQLRSFLYPAVKNLAVAARRKAVRAQSQNEHELDELPAPPAADSGDGPRDEMAAALAALPGLHREVLLLRFVDGLSLAEIAQALAVPLGTVKSRLHHALDTLRQDPRTKKLFGQ